MLTPRIIAAISFNNYCKVNYKLRRGECSSSPTQLSVGILTEICRTPIELGELDKMNSAEAEVP